MTQRGTLDLSLAAILTLPEVLLVESAKLSISILLKDMMVGIIAMELRVFPCQYYWTSLILLIVFQFYYFYYLFLLPFPQR